MIRRPKLSLVDFSTTSPILSYYDPSGTVKPGAEHAGRLFDNQSSVKDDRHTKDGAAVEKEAVPKSKGKEKVVASGVQKKGLTAWFQQKSGPAPPPVATPRGEASCSYATKPAKGRRPAKRPKRDDKDKEPAGIDISVSADSEESTDEDASDLDGWLVSNDEEGLYEGVEGDDKDDEL